MSRFFSILIIGSIGYWIIQNRYRIMNFVLSNRWIRSFTVSTLMNIPFIRQQMMGAVFSSKKITN